MADWLRRTAVAAALCTVVGSATGCTQAPADEPAAAPSSSPSASVHTGPNSLQLEARHHRIAQRIMHQRERAVHDRDEKAWLAVLDRSNTAMVRRQRRLFHNLVALPLAVYTLDAVDATWPSDFAQDRWRATAYIPYVEQRLQLRGFDPEPVTTTFGMTLAPVRGRWRIVSDDDVADREAEGARSAPWDLTRIDVHRTPHALGIFDAGSDGQAAQIMAWTEESVRRVRAAVPLRWPGDVVVYAPSERRVIAQLGKRMLSRAAVAFPVLDNNENPTRRVSTRVVINPKDLPRSELVGTYLLSHEITHVALARTAYGTPAWLQEGLADYVATRAGDPSIWYLAPSSVARAGKGVDAMPTSTYFGDDDPAFDYDLSLAACLVLAGRGGDARLWRFLSALDASADSAHPEGDADRVLRRSYGFDEAGLARRAARFLVRRGGS